MTERNFDLRLQNFREKYVVIRFWSEKDVKLRIKDIKLFYEEREYDLVPLSFMEINLKGNEPQCKNIDFPQVENIDFPEDRKYTSLTFIIKDMTFETQYAVQVPLDGGKCKFTEMLYGE